MPEGLIRFIVGFVALLVGWAIGFFDSRIRADKKIKQAEDSAQVAIRQAKDEARATRATTESAPPSQPGTTILRLWLDSGERPGLDLDGQTVDTSQISEPNCKRLVALLTFMRPWIEGKPIASAPISQPLAPAPAPRVIVSTHLPVTPPAKKDEKPAAPLSIVAQIDEILQARLASTALAERDIRLQESPEAGVIVRVGLQQFAGVGEVTDPEVQAVLRAAITEWEKKYTPGL
jgi:hypothetical protein